MRDTGAHGNPRQIRQGVDGSPVALALASPWLPRAPGATGEQLAVHRPGGGPDPFGQARGSPPLAEHAENGLGAGPRTAAALADAETGRFLEPRARRGPRA